MYMKKASCEMTQPYSSNTMYAQYAVDRNEMKDGKDTYIGLSFADFMKCRPPFIAGATMEVCQCAECNTADHYARDLVRAVRYTHMRDDDRKVLQASVDAAKKDIEDEKKGLSQEALEALTKKEQEYKLLQENLDAQCLSGKCKFEPFISFCLSLPSADYVTTRDLVRFVLCEGAITCAEASLADALKCANGRCDDCGFERRILKAVTECNALRDKMHLFHWTCWTKVTKVPPAPELATQAKNAMKRYEKLLEKTPDLLDQAGAASAAEAATKKQKRAKALEFLNDAKYKAVMCKLKLEDDLLKKNVKKNRVEEHNSTAAAAVTCEVHATDAKEKLRACCANDFDETIFEDREAKLEPAGNSVRGSYNVTNERGFLPFFEYVKAQQESFFVHDFRRRWTEKQKRLMQENLKVGDMSVLIDFAAKQELPQAFWTQEDSKAARSLSALVMIAGWRTQENGPLNYKSYTFLSDDPMNDAVFVYGAMQKLLHHIRVKARDAPPPFKRLYVISDGGPHHFRCQVSSYLM
jgi:hypothetical protein